MPRLRVPWSLPVHRGQPPPAWQPRRGLRGWPRLLAPRRGHVRRWPWLQWQPSDHPDHLAGIRAWRDDAGLANLQPPFALQAALPPAPPLAVPAGTARFDAAFSANTLHIMGWDHVQALFAGLPALLEGGALLAVYGPFNYGGRYSSDSNAQFDGWLKARDPRSGIRDAEAVQALAADNGFTRLGDLAMPANNRVLLWRLG